MREERTKIDELSSVDAIHNSELAARFHPILERAKERERMFADWLTRQHVEIVPCSVHPDVMRRIDRQASINSDQDVPGQWSLVYTSCSVCEEDKLLLKSGVPPVLIHARFNTFLPGDEVERSHLETVRQFTKQRVGFLVMVGGVGTGKSHLAVAAQREFTRAVFVKQSALLAMLRATYGDTNAVDPVTFCQRADLVVLDELGVSSGGRDELPLLHGILDHRYSEHRPTILTSNLTLEQLRDVLGDRMVDRLTECCFGPGVLSFGGKSHRRITAGLCRGMLIRLAALNPGIANHDNHAS